MYFFLFQGLTLSTIKTLKPSTNPLKTLFLKDYIMYLYLSTLKNETLITGYFLSTQDISHCRKT